MHDNEVYEVEYFPFGQSVHSFPFIYLPASHEAQTPVLKLHLVTVDDSVRHVAEQAVQVTVPVVFAYVLIGH